MHAQRTGALRIDAVLAAVESIAMLIAKALLASRLQAAETPGVVLRGAWSMFLVPLWCVCVLGVCVWEGCGVWEKMVQAHTPYTRNITHTDRTHAPSPMNTHHIHTPHTPHTPHTMHILMCNTHRVGWSISLLLRSRRQGAAPLPTLSDLQHVLCIFLALKVVCIV